jgi:hypothetical protein
MRTVMAGWICLLCRKDSMMDTQVETNEYANVEARKPYTPPQLIRYGDLAELTQFTLGGGSDGIGGSQPI